MTKKTTITRAAHHRRTTMTKLTNSGAKPRITLSAHDHERLSRLASAAASTMPDMSATLMDELDRAHVLAKGRHPVDVVCMGSEVVYRDDTTGRIQTVTLVYPNEADIAKGKASVLTPIGTALIGLAAGKSIDWRTRTGVMRRLTVLQAKEPARAEPREPESQSVLNQPA
jgi:regulator of nucleoside diphosphate kinase